MDINGTFILSGGTFTATNARMEVLSTFTISGAPTFSANGGTIRVGESGSITFTSNGKTFFNLEFFKTAGTASTVTLADDFTISGNLLVDKTGTNNFTVTPSGTRTITLKGDFTIANTSASTGVTFGNNSLTLLIDGTANQTFTQSGNSIFKTAININKSVSGDFVLGSNFEFGGNFTFTAGAVNQAGFPFILGAVLSSTITTNGLTFIDLTFKKTTSNATTLTLADDFTVTGTLLVDKTDASNFIINPSGTRIITLKGNFSIADTSASPDMTFGNNSLTLLVNGTSDQTFTQTGGFFSSAIDINKASGNFILASNFKFGADFTRTAGAVNQAGFAIILGDKLNATVTANGLSFVDLSFIKSTGTSSVLTLADDFTVTGNLVVDKSDNNGFTVSPSGTRTITLQGNFSIANVSALSTVTFGTVNLTLLLSGTAAQTLTRTGSSTNFNANLTINKSSGTASLASAFILNATGADLTVTSGNFDLNGFDLDVDDLFTVTDTLTLKGNETILFTTFTLDQTQSTVIWKDSAVTAVVTDLAASYFNFTYGASKTHKTAEGVGNGITVKGLLASNATAATRSVLRSTTDGVQWELDLVGTSALGNKVDVQDSDADAGNEVQAIGSLDNGNNDNWKFSALVALERHYPRGVVRGVVRGAV